MKQIKVLIVDDSALIRQVLTCIFSSDPGVEVVGSASDPYIAWEKIRALAPDVLTLDVEMPRMDGLTFLEKLMRARPMPVLMISSLTERGCETTFRALELGAVDFVTKPKIDVRQSTNEMAGEIISKLKIAAASRPRRHATAEILPAAGSARVHAPGFRATHRVVAAGASTGGTEALREFMSGMPADGPPILIVQHMPAGYTQAFAQRLDSLSKIRVTEARDGDRVLPGHALIAPGNRHMEVVRSGAVTSVRVFDGERVNHVRPSVDILFHSCARLLGQNALGVIMTGMGADGARGMQAMREAGAHTFAQDEATSVVFGMPREAIALGAVLEVHPLQELAAAVLRRLN